MKPIITYDELEAQSVAFNKTLYAFIEQHLGKDCAYQINLNIGGQKDQQEQLEKLHTEVQRALNIGAMVVQKIKNQEEEDNKRIVLSSLGDK